MTSDLETGPATCISAADIPDALLARVEIYVGQLAGFDAATCYALRPRPQRASGPEEQHGHLLHELWRRTPALIGSHANVAQAH